LKGREKILELRYLLNSRPLLSLNDLSSVIGTLLFASRTIGMPLCKYYYAIKMYRNFASRFGSTRSLPQFRLWRSAESVIHWWISDLLSSGMVDVSDMIDLGETLDCILFTDATPSGFGAVLLLPDGSIHTIGRSFNHQSFSSINELELRAVRYSLRHFDHLLQGRRVFLGVDNTSALHAMRVGSSHSYHLAREMNRLRTSAASIFVSYIRSADNPADELSRGAQLVLPKLNSAVSAIPSSVRRSPTCWSIGWSRTGPVLDSRRTGAGTTTNG
jgi:hypothetical protein